MGTTTALVEWALSPTAWMQAVSGFIVYFKVISFPHLLDKDKVNTINPSIYIGFMYIPLKMAYTQAQAAWRARIHYITHLAGIL